MVVTPQRAFCASSRPALLRGRDTARASGSMVLACDGSVDMADSGHSEGSTGRSGWQESSSAHFSAEHAFYTGTGLILIQGLDLVFGSPMTVAMTEREADFDTQLAALECRVA